MRICYVISDGFLNKLSKQYDPSDAQNLIDHLREEKERVEDVRTLFEKDYTGYDHLKQIRYSDWRVVSLYVSEFQLCELVQLNYVYRKNESGEPNDDILEEIDEMADKLFSKAADWPPSDESEYLNGMRTQLPEMR
ncbi:MAG: hypothetical protein ABEJ89_00050 [Haloarculaceae archaeon]